jgi:tetratricopeptide (TPR) repeat protein
MKSGMRVAVAGLALCAAALGLLSCRKPEVRPSLTVKFSAVGPEGVGLAGVSVEALSKTQGTTDAEGKLAFSFTADVGEEILVSAKLDRPGLQFKPWQQPLVVRKWDKARPETLEYVLEARLEPQALSSQIQLDAGGAPAAGAEVRVDGKPVTVDREGRLTVDLGAKLERPAKLSVKLREFRPYEETATLRAGETTVVTLVKIGVVYGKVMVAYEAMERLQPVAEAEVTLDGKAIGKTDATGSLRYQAPAKEATLEVRKGGFLPFPATAQAKARRADQILVPLVPREPPVYRLAMLAPQSGAPGDAELDAALPDIDDKLSDHLFAQPCFEKAPNEKAANATVAVVATRAEGGLLLSVKVAWANGKRIGAFAETGKFSRIAALSESVASKIREVFPFEGHVLGFEEGRILTSLGSGKGRGVSKGDAALLYHWDGKTPPKLAALGKAVVRRVDAEVSRLELQKGATMPAVGDKVVLVPRAAEAAFDSAVALTVKAGREGAEKPFPDVNVYRDGLWIGTTSAAGQIRVPVAAGEKHAFLFVRGGIKPYREEISVGPALEERTIVLPGITSRLKIESEPSGAIVRMDNEDLGATPLETDVLMGFHRVVVDAGGDWRAYDKVLEFKNTEESYAGSRRIVLQKDVLKQSESLLDKGDSDGAIALLARVQPGHPDYSAAHHRLAGLYLDEKKDPAHAIQEYQKVLELPENRELVNKRFAVTFLNLGRAYYQLGTPDGYQRAIEQLLVARNNKRFFPKDQYDQATHDTLYFLALSSHKLYHAQASDRLLQETSARWKDYFDYFPQSLQDAEGFKEARASGEQYYEEVRRKLREVE